MKDLDLGTHRFVCRSGPRIAGDQHSAVLTGGQSDEPIVCRSARHTTLLEFTVRTARGVGREHEQLGEIVVYQRNRICGSHARIPREASENRVRLGERVPAEAKHPSYGPGGDRTVSLVCFDEQRYGDARVERETRQRRPASINANMTSSETVVSERATRRPPSARDNRAVRPPGVTCIPPPYADTSTLEPGARPNASRRLLGRRSRPPESIVASMGLAYHSNPTNRLALRR
ncbi:MAG: hypothetical protein JWQ64_2000 [Subtercola sp.]|nr:hypothetical protein [Subtercola sp.]